MTEPITNKLYTLGYTGIKPEQLKALAEKLNAVVADIRYSRHSRVPHWSEKSLRELLGNRYWTVPEFGNINYRNGGPIKLFAPSLGRIIVFELLGRQSVILLCACEDVTYCHRKTAAEFIVGGLDLKPVHLSKKDL